MHPVLTVHDDLCAMHSTDVKRVSMHTLRGVQGWMDVAGLLGLRG